MAAGKEGTRVTVVLGRQAWDNLRWLVLQDRGESKTSMVRRAINLAALVREQEQRGTELAFVDEQGKVERGVVL